MIKFNSLEIQAYRSCKETKINLHPEFTALIGKNGSGKSNIMNALLLIKKIFNADYRPWIKDKDESSNKCKIKVELEYEKNLIYITGEILFETDEHNFDEILGVDLRWNLSSFISGSENIQLPSLYYSYAITADHSKMSIAKWLEIFNYPHERNKIKQTDEYLDLFAKVFPHINKIVDFINGIKYYSASQFGDPSKCPNYIEIDDDKPRLHRLRRSNFGHERYVYDLYKSWDKDNSEFANYLDIVNNNGIGLVDNIDFKKVKMPSTSIEVLSGGTVKTVEKNRVILVPTFYIDNNKLSPNQLSEGTLRALALIFYILNDKSKFLLLEEPEVCVHHGLLNSIIALLKSHSKHKQIVISTHSDYILDQLLPENLLLVTREVNNGTKVYNLPETMEKNEYEALKTYLKDSGSLGEYWKSGGLE